MDIDYKAAYIEAQLRLDECQKAYADLKSIHDNLCDEYDLLKRKVEYANRKSKTSAN